MQLERTDCEHSRVRKLNSIQVFVIRCEYKAGKRGLANCHRFNISAAHYNSVGRKAAWKGMKER